MWLGFEMVKQFSKVWDGIKQEKGGSLGAVSSTKAL